MRLSKIWVPVVLFLCGAAATLGAQYASNVFPSNGRVGIGTTTPTQALQVRGDQNAPTEIEVLNTSPDARGQAEVRVGNGVGGGDLFITGPNWTDGSNWRPNEVGVVAESTAAGLHFRTNGENYIRFSANDGNRTSELARFTNHGDFGIGTDAPLARLDVRGNARVEGLTILGDFTSEWSEVEEALEPGTVVVIDSEDGRRVRRSTQPYDTSIVGVVTNTSGLRFGESTGNGLRVAYSGRLKVKAVAMAEPIRPGDLLVTSLVAGTVMRSVPVRIGKTSMHRPGTIVGKALEGLASGRGDIMIVLTLR